MTEICLLSTRYLLLHEIENHHWLPEGFNLFVFAASKRLGKGLVIQNQFNTNYSQWCYIVASKNPCFGRCGWGVKAFSGIAMHFLHMGSDEATSKILYEYTMMFLFDFPCFSQASL